MVRARLLLSTVLASSIAVGAYPPVGESVQSTLAATTTYRVVGVTHRSSAQKDDPPFYKGSSTATWRLAAPSKSAPNLLSVTIAGPLVTGLATVNVRGTFKANATTNFPKTCSLRAATGSKTYPAVAPGPFQLVVGPDSKSASRVLVTHGIAGNVHASLSNPYFGSECSTSVAGQPSTDTLMTKSVPASLFAKPTVVVTYRGTTNRDKIRYSWSTVITLKRISTG